MAKTMDDLEAELLRYISGEVLAEPDAGLSAEEPMIENGRVDSIGLVQVLGFIGERWGVDLMKSGAPADFRSVASLADAIRREGRSG